MRRTAVTRCVPRSKGIGDRGAVAPLVGALRDDLSVARMEAASALGKLGEVTAPAREGARAGQAGVLVIRPEQVSIRAAADAVPDPNQFEGTVNDFLYIGDVTTYLVDLPDGTRLEALLANSAPGRARFFEVGDRVRLSWQAEAGAFLDS